jgi:AbrB family looped-hinge helix DNA binding protein
MIVIDAAGKITLPATVLQRRGLRPGDALELVEAEDGLILYPVDAETLAWWNSLSEAERQEAKVEARRYNALSEAERDALWQEEPVSIEEDAEGDEIELALR